MKFFHGIRFRDRRGMTLVWLALFLLPLLLFFAGLAIDIAYMYNVKNQLQVAADAAALAAVANLNAAIDNDPTAFTQLDARQAAWKLACKNAAGGDRVFLYTPGSCNPDSEPTCCDNPPSGGLNEASNSDPGGHGDIVVGNWDQTNTPRFTPATGSTGLAINAVKVVPKRAGQFAAMPAVRVFFGQVLRLIGIDWSLMGAGAEAIAASVTRANAPVALCYNTCDSSIVTVSESSPLTMYWSPYKTEEGEDANTSYQGIAWTTFNPTSPSTPTKDVVSYFCGKEANACFKYVHANNGSDEKSIRNFRCAFLNPVYDSANKICATSDGKCGPGDTVTSWDVIAPVFSTDDCPPGEEPGTRQVVAYAKMTIIDVYSTNKSIEPFCACVAYDAPSSPPSVPNGIVINKIECVDCPATSFFGNTHVLVK
jgi:hypothetical protein